MKIAIFNINHVNKRLRYIAFNEQEMERGKRHCEVVQSDQGVWLHSACRRWRKRRVRPHFGFELHLKPVLLHVHATEARPSMWIVTVASAAMLLVCVFAVLWPMKPH
jgi:hypothetical protein